jgi:glutamate-1-semialdehyde 2,1-aminomutase
VTTEIGRRNLDALIEEEQRRFAELHPRSREFARRAHASMLDGVPMPFMAEWPGLFPLFVQDAADAEVTDVDNVRYDDFCLGDTGAMAGHAPAPVVEALTACSRIGATHMLPTSDSIDVADDLRRRFQLPYWQFTVSATDANRFALRIARKVTGRTKVLVFNWCYHGTVDEASVAYVDGRVIPREPRSGQPVDPEQTTRVVEFNDTGALESALSDEDVACVLAEPAMTNIGIIHPDQGFHAALRELTRRHGALLILDETHSFCMGPGGCTAAWGLEPDMLVIGKAIAGGVPAGAYGLSERVAEEVRVRRGEDISVTGGIGGTLAGNALAARLMKITLEEVLTDDSFARMTRLAQRYTNGIEDAILGAGMPWHVALLGARAEYRFQPLPPRNGSEAMAADDRLLSKFMHLFALNRGVLLTPFHNMVLMSPATTDAQVDRAVAVFVDAAAAVQ